MIFLVRHGEAAASWGDAPDPGLSDRGHRQASAAAEALIAAGATQAVTSPMARCRETCRAFERATGRSAPVEPRISEIDTPAGLDDRSSWLKGVMAGRWADTGHDFGPWRQSALEAVSKAEDGTVFFSHFVAINAIVGLLDGAEDVLVFRPMHCSITRLERRDGQLIVGERGAEGESRVL